MNKKMQLFCIPYAGGTADCFQELGQYLEHEVLLVPIEYAGHGTRKSEKFYQNFQELQRDVIRQIKEKRDRDVPYAVFGYSMGSVAAYGAAVARDMQSGLKHVFLAAHEAPDVEWRGKKYAQLDDQAFLGMLKELGGFQKLEERMLKNRFFRQLYFQPIREDYRLLAEYQLEEKRRIPVDTTVFYSSRDIAEQEIRTWDSFAGKEIEYIELGENHFFIRQYAKEMADIIRQRITGRESYAANLQ